MVLTDFQKQLIQDIADENIVDFTSFLKIYGNLYKSRAKANCGGFYQADFNQPILIPNNKDETLNKAKEFIKILRMLERLNLTTRVHSKPLVSSSAIKIWTDDRSPFNDLSYLHKDFEPSIIVVFPQLNDFIERGFLTPEEQEIKEERRSRKREQRITISVAIGTVILSTVLNYFIWSNEREIIIKENKTHNDTLKVQIVSTSDENVIDTKIRLDSLTSTPPPSSDD